MFWLFLISIILFPSMSNIILQVFLVSSTYSLRISFYPSLSLIFYYKIFAMIFNISFFASFWHIYIFFGTPTFSMRSHSSFSSAYFPVYLHFLCIPIRSDSSSFFVHSLCLPIYFDAFLFLLLPCSCYMYIWQTLIKPIGCCVANQFRTGNSAKIIILFHHSSSVVPSTNRFRSYLFNWHIHSNFPAKCNSHSSIFCISLYATPTSTSTVEIPSSY